MAQRKSARNSGTTSRNNVKSSPKGAAKSGSKPSSKRSLTSQGETRATRKTPDETEGGNRLLDDAARRNLGGIAFLVLAVVLLVCAVLPTTGVVSGFVSTVLHLGLGMGCYILPLFVFGFAVGYFFQNSDERIAGRVAIGLFLIFVALLGLLALFTPGSGEAQIAALFTESNLRALGGYVGAGLAWCGLTLFGNVITAVILLGIIASGLVVIGFSVSALVERVQRTREDASAYEADAAQEQNYVPAARVAYGEPPAGTGDAIHAAQTVKYAAYAPAPSHPDDAAATRKIPADPPDSLIRPLRTDAVADGAEASSGARKGGNGAKKPARTSTRKPAAQAFPTPTEDFELPPMALLGTSPKITKGSVGEAVLKETAEALQGTLEDFGIMATVVGWVPGPTVTLFKVSLPAGVRVSRVTALNDDIALALAAPGVRIFAPIPGTNYVGIEVPNATRQTVLLGDVLPQAGSGPLQIAIGKDVEGNCIVSDLSKMPHLLIGGTTGSGKSVSINAMIMSILMRATPDEVRLILIDPKRVEFTLYNDIPHLYVPVVTEPKEAASALSWGVAEMERRLKVFSKAGARNIAQYNAKVQGAEEGEGGSELPYIVIVIDELADLMMNVGKEVEFSISRIAQLARAAGIHLIVATQRPSANVVTGLIKANITNRIAFNVASSIDSRVILDTIGAESLIGLGDLLLSKPELSKPQRIQGCYVSEDEINEAVEFLKEQGDPEYHTEILSTNLISIGSSNPDPGATSDLGDDPLVWEAAEMVVSSGLGSTSNIQRRFKVGYARAGRIMDLLEEKGIVGPQIGSKPREVLIDTLELETLKSFEMNER